MSEAATITETFGDAGAGRGAGAAARGAPSSEVQTIGLGEGCPAASNDTAAGRQQDRRVDVVFSNASGQFSEAARSRQSAIRR